MESRIVSFNKKQKGMAGAEQASQINVLEELLMQARAGRLKAVAVAGVVDPYAPPNIPVAVVTYHTPSEDMGDDYYPLIGALEDLKFEMLIYREGPNDFKDGDFDDAG